MIYASLKTIRQWHTFFTPLNFILLGLLLGALALLVFFAAKGLPLGWLTSVSILLLILAFCAKIAYFVFIGQPAGPSVNTALGFSKATVRLLDVGHSSGTFLTDEFGFELAKTKIQWLRVVFIGAAFIVPLVILSGLVVVVGPVSVMVALIIAWLGIFLERWLFFAEARHVVTLYHGQQNV